jgi:hypothetical protein
VGLEWAGQHPEAPEGRLERVAGVNSPMLSAGVSCAGPHRLNSLGMCTCGGAWQFGPGPPFTSERNCVAEWGLQHTQHVHIVRPGCQLRGRGVSRAKLAHGKPLSRAPLAFMNIAATALKA